MGAKFFREHLGLLISSIVVFFAIILSLFNHFEMGGETWGYWFFARLFSETGKFIILDRSPLYTLYLNIFSWMGYPMSVTVEYLVTTTITVIALVLFLKKHIGLGWATFAAILWIPFIQMSEPPVQKLALACSFFAVIVRQKGDSRLNYMASYACLSFAYMFRLTYILLIPLFVFYDLIRLIKSKKNISWRINLSSDWPVIAVLGLLMWFLAMQSPHPWNNAWTATTNWAPNNGKSLSQASFSQHINWMYIWNKYKSFENKDFYFTNKEIFGGHNDFLGAIYYGRQVVTKLILSNAFSNPLQLLGATEFYQIYQNRLFSPHSLKVWMLAYLALLFLFYGAFRSVAKDKLMVLFLAGSTLLILSNILSMPKLRYMFPAIPILTLSAYWYASNINAYNKIFNSKLVVLMAIVFFSNGLSGWSVIVGDLTNDFVKKDIRVLESRPYSMKAAFGKLADTIKHKKGIISLEHTYIGAFTATPFNNIYDVWEIPPFGRFEESGYNGLIPKRIDCVLVSHEFNSGIGCATNYQIRRQNYIKPYINKLLAKGAKYIVIPQYGYAVSI